MVSWEEVRRWDPVPLQDAVGTLNAEYNKLIPASEDLRGLTTPHGWTGEAADAAARRVTGLVDRLEAWAAELVAARTAAANVGDAIAGVRRGADEAADLAVARKFTIADDGVVTDLAPDQAEVEDRRSFAAELADRVRQVLLSANDVDNDFCAVLDRLLNHSVYDSTTNDNSATSLAASGALGSQAGGLTIPPPPADGATAAQNAAYWATLSDQQRKQLALDRPNLVGPRDGFTAEHRDLANRALLDQQRTGLRGDLARLREELSGLTNGPGHAYDRGRLQNQIDAVQGKLTGLNDIQARLDSNPSLPEDRRYYLLGIDASGDGKAVLASGNPDTARNVATFVPGTGTDLSTIGDTIDRSDVMHRAADKTGTGPNSVVSWLGYDAPDAVSDAAFSGYAEDARKPLDSFQDGLRESHVGAPSHNTVVGHSYGSTVAGFTARDEHLAIDSFVAVGSPGVGVDEVSGLHLPPDRVWAIAAENDPVADLQRFGNAPTDPDFGANKIVAAPGTSWPVVGYSLPAHSEYWDPRTPSLDAVGHVIAGRQPGHA